MPFYLLSKSPPVTPTGRHVNRPCTNTHGPINPLLQRFALGIGCLVRRAIIPRRGRWRHRPPNVRGLQHCAVQVHSRHDRAESQSVFARGKPHVRDSIPHPVFVGLAVTIKCPASLASRVSQFVTIVVLIFDSTEKSDMFRNSPIGLQLHGNDRPQEYRCRGLVWTKTPEDRLIPLQQ